MGGNDVWVYVVQGFAHRWGGAVGRDIDGLRETFPLIFNSILSWKFNLVVFRITNNSVSPGIRYCIQTDTRTVTVTYTGGGR